MLYVKDDYDVFYLTCYFFFSLDQIPRPFDIINSVCRYRVTVTLCALIRIVIITGRNTIVVHITHVTAMYLVQDLILPCVCQVSLARHNYHFLERQGHLRTNNIRAHQEHNKTDMTIEMLHAQY